MTSFSPKHRGEHMSEYQYRTAEIILPVAMELNKYDEQNVEEELLAREHERQSIVAQSEM